jgi:hypothetical protein
MCELLVGGLPLKSDAVESQKVNDLLVRLAEVCVGLKPQSICLHGSSCHGCEQLE